MIFGIGNDIIELERLKQSLDKGEAFLKLVYAPNEIAYCEKQANKVAAYAARFAAKEAFLKALGTGWIGEMQLHDIEVTKDELGKPNLLLKNEVMVAVDEREIKNVHLSISHTKHFANAVVILEK